MVETHTWLSMHHYSWSFVCVTFHVITWLLSFIVKIMSFMPMFCNIPRFYQILGEFFLLLFYLCWLKIHKDLKLFEFIQKPCLRVNFKMISYKVFSLILKRINSKLHFKLVLCKQSHLAQITIFIKILFFSENLFLIDLEHCSEY
jgi:hypothetical protein